MENFDIKKFKEIKLLVLDFDGVLTDNRVFVSEDGKESVACNRSDGLGIEMLQKKGVKVVVISKEKNNVVQARCKKLEVECKTGIDNKIDLFLQIVKENNLSMGQVCYVGNDIVDVDCIKAAGIGTAVADAYKCAIKSAKYVCKNKGGYGAVREVADLILN